MEDIFEKLQEQMKESNERWKEINEVSEKLRYLMDNDLYSGEENFSVNIMMVNLILLLVDQLKPMYSSGEQVAKLQDDIKNMLGSITGGKK